MLRRTRVLSALVVAIGALLGYAAATGKVSSLLRADDKKALARDNGGQVADKPGSPSGTTTISGKQLPPPPAKFGGVIKESAKDSKPWWPPRVVPPKGAPNVLL